MLYEALFLFSKENLISSSFVLGYFRKYDNGYFLNMVRYKRMAPPEYQLERITVPVALFYGKNDFLSTVEVNVSVACKINIS